VKRHLGDRTDPPVGFVECGNEILIRFEVSPLVPLHMANKQILGSWFPAMMDCSDNPGCQTNVTEPKLLFSRYTSCFPLLRMARRTLALPHCIAEVL
jgi:hypothetical protein